MASETSWGRHAGEIRVLVRPDRRRAGLGFQLASGVFAGAERAGMAKLVARMIAEQKRKLARLARLGLEGEAILRGFALDGEDSRGDLLMMSAGVGNLTNVEQAGSWRQS